MQRLFRELPTETFCQANLQDHPLLAISQELVNKSVTRGELPVGGVQGVIGNSPKVGITMTEHQGSSVVRQRYAGFVRKFGGTPLLLPTVANLAPEYVNFLDGVILTGGGDISPRMWGGENHHAGTSNQAVDPTRDKFELDLITQARESGKPVFGVCRGMQMINVANGGSLKHLTDRHAPPNHDYHGMILNMHPIIIEHKSFMSEFFERERIDVNSGHHFCVDRKGVELRISATSEDGVIEAIEGDRIMGVQFHPEAMDGDVPNLLFKRFIDMARNR